jgi:hypothetical protein
MNEQEDKNTSACQRTVSATSYSPKRFRHSRNHYDSKDAITAHVTYLLTYSMEQSPSWEANQ